MPLRDKLKDKFMKPGQSSAIRRPETPPRIDPSSSSSSTSSASSSSTSFESSLTDAYVSRLEYSDADKILDTKRASLDEHNGHPSNLIKAIATQDLLQIYTILNNISHPTLTAKSLSPPTSPDSVESSEALSFTDEDAEAYANGLKHGIEGDDTVVRHLAFFCRKRLGESEKEDEDQNEEEESSETGSDSGSSTDEEEEEEEEEEEDDDDDLKSPIDVYKKMFDMVLRKYKKHNASLPNTVLLFNQRAFGDHGRWFLEKIWQYNLDHRNNFGGQETSWQGDSSRESLVSALDTIVTDENHSNNDFDLIKSICTLGNEGNDLKEPWEVVVEYATANHQTSMLIYALREGGLLTSGKHERKKILKMILSKHKETKTPLPNELFLFIHSAFGDDKEHRRRRLLNKVWSFNLDQRSNSEAKETNWKEAASCDLLMSVLDTIVTGEGYSDEDFDSKSSGIVKFICTIANEDNKLVEPWQVVVNYAISNQQTHMLRYALCEGNFLATENKQSLIELLQMALDREKDFAISEIMLAIHRSQGKDFKGFSRFMGKLRK